MSQPIIELSHPECVELLHTQVVGRVALHTRLGTRIVPVSYSIVDDAIVWRTAAYSELATYGRGVRAAFEVDAIDHDSRQGWSVVAYGRVDVVEEPEEIAHIRRVEDPAPWAAGLRQLYMRMPHDDLTGRRLGYAARPAYAAAVVPPVDVAEAR